MIEENLNNITQELQAPSTSNKEQHSYVARNGIKWTGDSDIQETHEDEETIAKLKYLVPH